MKKAAVGLVLLAAVVAALAAFTTISSSTRSAHQSGSYSEQLVACHSLPNGSVQNEIETSRMFINLPRALYPADVTGYFKTVQGDATAGYISNGGLPGNSLQATSNCSSTYFEFNGTGEVDLTVPSTSGASAYSVRFIVAQGRHTVVSCACSIHAGNGRRHRYARPYVAPWSTIRQNRSVLISRTRRQSGCSRQILLLRIRQ